jgi:hypothetical protein
MSRYAKEYSGERRTAKVTVQLTPSERTALEKDAEGRGTSLSQLARELCLRRSSLTSPVVAGTRRDPHARAIVQELTAIGNNLNQLTKLANTNKAAPQHQELRSTTELLKAALHRVIGGA